MEQERNAGSGSAAGGRDREWLNLHELEDLKRAGEIMDGRQAGIDGRIAAIELAGKFLRVRTREGGIGPLAANQVQRDFEDKRGERNIVLKARQMGLTTWVAARFFLRTITHPGALTLEVAHTQEAAEEIFRIVHRFYQHLPEDLREGPLKTSRANSRQLVFPNLDAQYRVESAGDRNAGRGLTVQNLHCSELARWPREPGETLAGLRASLSPGGELVMESTPLGVGGCFFDEWQRAGKTGTVKHFFPWWREGDYVAAAVDPANYTEEERELAERAGLSPEQIGYRRQLRANFGKMARQEYAEDPDECFSMSGDCFFEAEMVERRLRELIAMPGTDGGGDLQVWLPAIPGRSYVVSVDPAGGGSAGDYSAIEVIDMESGMQCAEYQAHVGGLELARKAAELAERYNHAHLAVERNNHGCGVLAYLHSDCKYSRIYEQSGQAGWLTTSLSKPQVLAALGSALVEAAGNFLSTRFLSECRTFVRQPNGSAGAQSGTHDDLVMAMAIGLGARKDILSRR